ncbi:MAG: hypothetical protein R3B48_11220 [Kofleriaceae bacterium]
MSLVEREEVLVVCVHRGSKVPLGVRGAVSAALLGVLVGEELRLPVDDELAELVGAGEGALEGSKA